MVGGILIGIFGNLIYDLIKRVLKDSITDKDVDLIDRIHCALEKASSRFFEHYGDEFGERVHMSTR